MSEATWWGAAVSGSAEVRPSASLERNEGGARMHDVTHTHTRTHAHIHTHMQVKSGF